MYNNIATKAKIDLSVKFMNNIIISDDVIIEENVQIGNNVIIYNGVRVGKNTKILDNTILGRKPLATGAVERKISEDIKELLIGENCVIGAAAIIYSGSEIGNNVLISDNASIREECKIGDECIISRGVTINYNTKIGKRVKIMDLSHITGNMIIEDDVFISVGVVSTNDNTMGREAYGEEHVKGPVIRKNVTIGGGACILPGVEIGENSIIGMGAVVSKNISARKVAMGIPAKEVKNVDESMLKGV